MNLGLFSPRDGGRGSEAVRNSTIKWAKKVDLNLGNTMKVCTVLCYCSTGSQFSVAAFSPKFCKPSVVSGVILLLTLTIFRPSNGR